MFKSIRHGVFAAMAGYALLLCVCYTGLMLVIAYVTEDMLIDRLLQREAARLTPQLVRDGAAAGLPGDLIRVYAAIDALPAAVRGPARAGAARAEIFSGTGHHYHLRTLAAGGQTVYLVADAAPLLVVSALVEEVGGLLAAIGAGLVGLALLPAWLLSRRLVSPLQGLAEELRAASPGTPVVLSAQGRPDEIGYLARKLADTLAQLHAALARERAFTRDVSHELRTPLTVMNNTLVKAGMGPLDADAAAQLRASAGEITATIDLLFALARAEQAADTAFDLRGCIEDSLLRLIDDDWQEDRLVLDLPERLSVIGNPQLAALLLNNCLGNALFHGGPGAQLTVRFAAGRLWVSNQVDPARPATVQGFRHGQNLLVRIAAALRWQLAFHPGGVDYGVEIVPRQADQAGK